MKLWSFSLCGACELIFTILIMFQLSAFLYTLLGFSYNFKHFNPFIEIHILNNICGDVKLLSTYIIFQIVNNLLLIA